LEPTGTSHTVAEDAFHFTVTISDDTLTHVIIEGQDRVKKVVSHATGLSKDNRHLYYRYHHDQ